MNFELKYSNVFKLIKKKGNFCYFIFSMKNVNKSMKQTKVL